MPPRTMEEGIQTLLDEFQIAENSIHAKNLKFTKELKRLREVNPDALRPLIDAYAHTKGDVDSLAKLYKWAAEQITPLGLIKSPDPKNMNLFAKGAWGVRYNNMLSGISAFRAGVGNGSQLILDLSQLYLVTLSGVTWIIYLKLFITMVLYGKLTDVHYLTHLK